MRVVPRILWYTLYWSIEFGFPSQISYLIPSLLQAPHLFLHSGPIVAYNPYVHLLCEWYLQLVGAWLAMTMVIWHHLTISCHFQNVSPARCMAVTPRFPHGIALHLLASVR